MMRWPDRAFHDTNILRVNMERSLEVQNLLMAACLPVLTTPPTHSRLQDVGANHESSSEGCCCGRHRLGTLGRVPESVGAPLTSSLMC